MNMAHCFISYSNADGLDFATRLANELGGGYPFIKVWFDKNEMSSSGDDWDDQISSAISGCKCLLFLMSVDSTAKNSNCKAEWTWALKCKKPVICLLLDKKAVDQFRLSSRQKIDFSSNFDAGMAQLRKAIARLDTHEGLLDELKHRLADANRDLYRAKDEDKPRIKAEIEELKSQIQIQEKIVANPQAAQEQTQKNIEAGLERERQPDKPAAAKTATRFINPPPGIAPYYFQDRLIETEQTVGFLQDDAQRLMTIVGRGGVGKTAMVCRLLKGLESGELPNDLGTMKTEGIVYLSEIGSHRANFANIFYDLSKLLPTETVQQQDAVYKNPQAGTESKMNTLLEHFSGGHIVLLLDNFETLVDTETLTIRDAELNEALCTFLNGTHTAVNVIITTRIAPRSLNLTQPGRQRLLILDEGLDSPYAENILREMDADGRLGLKNATADLLGRARECTRGYPRALEALFAILASDRYTTLEELLAMPMPENVVEALVGEAFNRLDVNAQKVMQALATYNRPVAPAALDYLLAPHLPAIDSVPILQRLANMHFARKEKGKFYLHPVDRKYAFDLIPEESQTTALQREETEKPVPSESPSLNAFIKHDLLIHAADYFSQARKPLAEWKKLDDLAAQLAEFDLRCAAGDYDAAADVLTDIDSDYLLLWGHYRLMIDLHLRVKDKITDKHLSMGNLNGLGLAYRNIGKVKESITILKQGLDAAREAKDRNWEGTFLGNLGLAYADLGDARKAIELYEQQLVIVREIGDRRGEGNALGNLGNAYAALGDARKAIELYEQRLVIAREIGDRRGEGTALGNLGNAYAALGDARKAIEFYEQLLLIAREIGDRRGEGAALGNLGLAYAALGDARKAIEFHEQDLVIAQEIGGRSGEGICLGNIAEERINLGEYGLAIQSAEQYVKICEEISKPASYAFGRLAQAYLYKTEFIKAREAIEAALQYDVPQNNHNATALHGIIILRQGDTETAREAFVKSITQADEILAKTPDFYDALDAKGLALVGVGLLRRMEKSSDTGMPQDVVNASEKSPARTEIGQAIECFLAARLIAPHAGVVKRVLRLFDELVKCDAEADLKEVRKAIEGN